MKRLCANNLPVMLRGSLVVLLVAARCARAFDAELDCAMRRSRDAARSRVGDDPRSAGLGRSADGRVREPSPSPPPAARPAIRDTPIVIHVSARDDDRAAVAGAPLATLEAARDAVRARRASPAHAAATVRVLEGVHALRDRWSSGPRTRARRGRRGRRARAVAHLGGARVPAAWRPSTEFDPPVVESALPRGSSRARPRSSRTRRARSPGAGWCGRAGPAAASARPPARRARAARRAGVAARPRRGAGRRASSWATRRATRRRPSRVRPRPRPPGRGRRPGPHVWYSEGDAGGRRGAPTASRSGSVHRGGLVYNATGGVDRNGYQVAGFNASGWSASAPRAGRAFVFHNALWGSWVFSLARVEPDNHTLTFETGGWQEGRGGAISEQPFYVEGIAEALDAACEWFVTGDVAAPRSFTCSRTRRARPTCRRR